MKKALHTTNVFYLILLILLVSACEKEVTLQIEDVDQKLAVLCNFSPDEPFFLHLSKSQSIFSPQTEDNLIDNANVQLCLDNILIEKIQPTSTGVDAGSKFQSIIAIPQTRKTYTLKIEVDGLESITATSTIPEPVEITHSTIASITAFEANEFTQTQDYEVRLGVQFSDPIGQENYYQITFYQELISGGPNNVGLDPVKKIIASKGYSFVDDKLANNFNVADAGILFKDFTFNGTTKEFVFQPLFEFDYTNFEPSNIIIELRTVSEEYYNYYTSVYRQTSQGNVPFSDPTILYSNIKNGYGVFAGYSKVQVKSEIEF